MEEGLKQLEQHLEEQTAAELRHEHETEELTRQILACVAAEQKMAMRNQAATQSHAEVETKLQEEKEVLLKEKAQMEEVLEQVKAQHRDEKKGTELRYEHEIEELKQNILNLKASVASQQETAMAHQAAAQSHAEVETKLKER